MLARPSGSALPGIMPFLARHDIDVRDGLYVLLSVSRQSYDGFDGAIRFLDASSVC